MVVVHILRDHYNKLEYIVKNNKTNWNNCNSIHDCMINTAEKKRVEKG